MVKNGGNVVSYFCTPEGRLIHAVGGPVSPHVLLAEAKWAVDVVNQMRRDPRKSKADMLREAHRYAATPHQSKSSNNNWLKQITHTRSTSHQMMAKYAYLPMADVEKELFRALTGEKFEMDRSAVVEAARIFEVAETRNRPILLVLESDEKNMSGFNHSRSGSVEYLFNRFKTKRHLGKFTVVHVPKIQLPAFTNLKELTGWEKIESSSNDRNWKNRDTCLVVSPGGEILSKLKLDDSTLDDQLKEALASWENRTTGKVVANSQSKL